MGEAEGLTNGYFTIHQLASEVKMPSWPVGEAADKSVAFDEQQND